MLDLIEFFNCGHLNPKTNGASNLTIRNFSDIKNKIIPLFLKYPILGQKLLDFQDLVEASKLISNKEHLTPEGLIKIREIKDRMNTKREV